VRILFVSHSFPLPGNPLSNVGGMQRVAAIPIEVETAASAAGKLTDILHVHFSEIHIDGG